MENLSLILFISFAAPLTMTLFILKGNSRTLMVFLLLGIVVSLFCGEFNAIVMNMGSFDRRYFTVGYTPIFEEIFKAIPILIYAFLYHPKRQMLLECSLLVGVGFSILENAFILGGSIGTVSIFNAVIRGFGTGIMHVLCTMAIGYGISFVHTRRKLFYTGTIALLSIAISFHSIYNCLVQSEHQLVGFILPSLIFIITLMIFNKRAGDAQ